MTECKKPKKRQHRECFKECKCMRKTSDDNPKKWGQIQKTWSKNVWINLKIFTRRLFGVPDYEPVIRFPKFQYGGPITTLCTRKINRNSRKWSKISHSEFLILQITNSVLEIENSKVTRTTFGRFKMNSLWRKIWRQI